MLICSSKLLLEERLGFDPKILLPKNSKNESKENLKLIYKIRNEEKNILEGKSVVTKI